MQHQRKSMLKMNRTKILSTIPKLLFILISTSKTAFTARKQLPFTVVCISIQNMEPMLPYYLGQLENLEYSKSRLSVSIFTACNEDGTFEALFKWKNGVKHLYKDVDIHDNQNGTQRCENTDLQLIEKGIFFDQCISEAIVAEADYVLILDSRVMLTDRKSLQKLQHFQKSVVMPNLLHGTVKQNNNRFWLEDQFSQKAGQSWGVTEVDDVSLCYLISLSNSKIGHMTHQWSLLKKTMIPATNNFYQVFSESCLQYMVEMFESNAKMGLVLPDRFDSDSYQDHVRQCLQAIMDKQALGSKLLHSPKLQPQWPEATKLGLDEIYVINLDRRTDRWNRIQYVMKTLGVKFTRWPAVNGRELTSNDLKKYGVEVMDGYEDPFMKRPLTLGEVGIFLSQYAVWQDMLARNYKRALILEDDGRFLVDFADRMHQLMDALDSDDDFQWDLIYLAGKTVDPTFKPKAVHNQPQLRTVGYTYWALAYILTQRGAAKLLAAEPLSKMIALDEFLPIMYDGHPNHEWAARFEGRDLVAFATRVQLVPLSDPVKCPEECQMFWECPLVEPLYFTTMKGYVSDTEWSPTVDTVVGNLTGKK